MNKPLFYSPLSKDCITETSAFFEIQIGQMKEFEYSWASIVTHVANHSVHELLDKIGNPKRHFELIRDKNKDNKIIGYFESRPVEEDTGSEIQFIQWIFVDPLYARKGLAWKLFEHFHAFCHTHGYQKVKSYVREMNTASREMHEKFWYREEKNENGEITYMKKFTSNN